MKKFIVIYSASRSAMEQMKNSTPEETKESMKKWETWAQKCGEGLVDIGSPLGNGQKMNVNGVTASQSGIVGYSFLQADDLEGAQELLKEHPHMGWNDGCEIEVHECLPMPGSE